MIQPRSSSPRPRGRALALLIALIALSVSCVRYGPRYRYVTQTTGTCPGACSHYLTCRGTPEDQQAYGRCVQECREIYEDNPQTLATYERLSCEDAVAFIEGDSGRGPGE